MSKTVGVVLSLKDKFSGNLKNVALQLNTTEAKLKKANLQIKKFEGNISRGFRNVSLAVGSAVIGLGGGLLTLGMQSAEAGDRVVKMSQKLGMSMKAFQEWDYILKQNGVDIESFKVGMKTLTAAIVATTKGKAGKPFIEMFRQLGVHVKDSTGHFRKQEDILKDTVNAFQKMPDGVMKAYYAQKLFGKQGRELLPLLNAQAGSAEELRAKAHKLGLILSDSVLQKANETKDTMKTLNSSFEVLGFSIGNAALPTIQLFATEIINNMPKIRSVVASSLNFLNNTIKFLGNNLNWIIPVVTGVVSAIGTFKTITFVLTLYKEWITLSKALAITQGIVNAVTIANPIGLTVVAIGAVIGAITFLVLNWKKVISVLKIAWDWIKKVTLGLLGIHDKKVNLTVNKSTGPDLTNRPMEMRSAPHHALGTNYFRGGLTHINERGGEMINLPSGSQIIPHDLSKQTMNNSTSKKPIVINIDTFIGTKEFLAEIEASIARKFSHAIANG